MHYQFLVDRAKMANTGVAQGEGASADRALERLVARVGLPVPERVVLIMLMVDIKDQDKINNQDGTS